MTPIEIHYQSISNFITQRVNNQTDAEDLTQEVFYKMIRSEQKGTTIDNAQKWLYTIARNTIVDYYRKRKIITEDVTELEVELPKECKTFAITKEEEIRFKNYLHQMIDELPEDYKLLIKMSEIQGMSQKEIAEELGMNPTTVRSKVQRGRAKLKKKITDCCDVMQGGKGSIIDYKRAKNSSCYCQNDCKD